MTATDTQVRIMMRERQQGKTQTQAAAKANLRSRKTAAKYERLDQLPSQLKTPRSYRTRPDPFADIWEQAGEMLAEAPELEAKALFEWFCEQAPGRFQEGQLRSFQRRVLDWRAVHQDQTAVLEQVHRPGEVLETDGVHLAELGVTIAGQLLDHLLIHSVLPYSNWEWGYLAQSESLLALRGGLMASLGRLKAVPQYHRTDNSSAATHAPGGGEDELRAISGRGYNPAYLQLLAHYGLEPQTTHLSSPQENGDVESLHSGLKRALKQHLLLRGSRDFADLAAYQAFVEQVLERRNAGRQLRLTEELAVMKPLAAGKLAGHSQLRLRVTKGSLIRVLGHSYSVPTSLIDHQVTVYVHEWHLEVWYGHKKMLEVARLTGEGQAQVNYRHVIDSLLRKPGGFRDYRYREALFPQLVFRRAWEQLNTWFSPRKADLSYLRVLHLAARTMESEVAAILEQLLASGRRWDEGEVERRLGLPAAGIPDLPQPPVSLEVYDRLLREGSHVRT